MKKQFLVDRILGWYRRRELESKDFSVVCNTCCAGAGIYHKFQLKYASPTIGTFFFYEDYIKFLENFSTYIRKPIEFGSKSKYDLANKRLAQRYYPLGMLDDVEIHFIHYKNEADATDKWERRTKRINFGNLFFIFVELLQEENFSQEWLDRFAKLPYEHKLFISTEPRGYDDIVVCIKEQNGGPVNNFIVGRPYEKYFNVVKWLNCNSNFKR